MLPWRRVELNPAVHRSISKLCSKILILIGLKQLLKYLTGTILRITQIIVHHSGAYLMRRNKKLSEWGKAEKRARSLTCIYILTDINASWGLTDSTPCYMKNSIKNIWMAIMHSHSAKTQKKVSSVNRT